MYEQLSNYYDDFMQEVPYDEWVDFLAYIIGNRKRGFEVGCGTGSIALRLIERGYAVSGCDVSTEMLSVCRARADEVGLDIPLYQMSGENLVCGEKQEFITANCDVVNYMKKPEKFFARAYNNLTDGGVLIFDISSEYKLKEILGNSVFTEENNGVTYIWENALNRDSVDMFLTFFVPDGKGKYEKKTEEQRQYIHGEQEIIEKLKTAGFSKVKSVNFLSTRRGKAKCERIQFIAIK